MLLYSSIMNTIHSHTEQHTAAHIQEAISNGNEEIQSQNERLERVSDISSTAIQSVVREGIRDEQIDSFVGILQGIKGYDSLSESLAAQAGELEAELVSALQVEESLERDRELALQLTSRRESEILQVYHDELAAARVERIQSTQAELSILYSQMESLGAAWAIPQAIAPDERSALYEAVKEQEESDIIVDILPVTPEKISRMSVLVERAKYQIENPDLSKQVLFYLREEMGKTVTVEDLIRFCYSLEDAGHDINYRSRITTTLGPESEGRKKQLELAKEDLVLQYGIRYIYRKNKDGQLVVRRRTRIYRVVPAFTETEASIIVATGDLQVEDRWNRSSAEVRSANTAVEEVQGTTEVIALSPEVNHINDESVEEPVYRGMRSNWYEEGIVALAAIARREAVRASKYCLPGENTQERYNSSERNRRLSRQNVTNAFETVHDQLSGL